MILRTSWPDLFGHRRHRIAPDVKVVDARDKGRAEGQQKEEIRCCVGPFLKGMAATAAGGSLARSATPLKIGISIPLTGCRLQCNCKPRSNFTCSNTATRL